MKNNLEKIKEELQDICPAKRDYTYPIFSNSWSGWKIYSLGPKIIAKGVYKGLIGRTLIYKNNKWCETNSFSTGSLGTPDDTINYEP